ncbi:MAG: tRNA uridine-5-carboxymethylaminomethyl(34) synthesis GTPase MnmE [Rhodospirillaceae bacterium]|nr:tRNA uridine-5-carboxymethylaminomethyl(34) synthesis GTPase MnmE [Rhodospirillaceae bacterium]
MSGHTIFALASGGARAGVAVIRLSGPGAAAALTALAPGKPLADPRRAVLRALRDPATGEVLDQALVLFFPGPGSFTGEDVAEFHLHGGPAVVEGVLAALGQVAGLRPAEAGEFTRRAFLNGKLDLTQAEAIADLVAAETSEQRRQALDQAAGALGQIYEGWRARLIAAIAHVEAGIDFADEDLPEDIDRAARDALAALAGEIAAHLDDGRRGERLRAGVHLALLGRPNAGKSTLLNLLAGRDAAIVSETAGTTRDVIEVHLDLGGVPVIVADTAGLRDSADAVEREGVRRAAARADWADLKLIVLDRADWPDVPADLRALAADGRALVLVNKADLAPVETVEDLGPAPVLALSARTGAGVEVFLSVLTAKVRDLAVAGAGASAAPTRARHRHALEEARTALAAALDGWSTRGPELVAEDLRLAARAIGRITGRVDVEDLLDVIFAEFCIGK